MSTVQNHKEWKCLECKHTFLPSHPNYNCSKCGNEDTFPAHPSTALESLTIPNFDIKLRSRFILSDKDINNYLLSTQTTGSKTERNRFIGALGEAEAALFFVKKGYAVTDYFHIDLVIKKNDILCLIDVKTTTQDKWFPKKYFKNKQRQQEAFGFSLDEYLRIKILLNPYRVIFNEEDVIKIETYFN